MEAIFFEEKQNIRAGITNWQDLMTEEEYKRGQYYVNQYLLRSGEIQSNKTLWDRLIELNACQREADADDPDYPNNFVPLITPAVEGQVAAIIEGDIEFTHHTDNPIHKDFMKRFDAASFYIRRMNRFTDHFKDFTRQYDLLGNAIITVSWEQGYSRQAGKPKGFPRITICPLLTVMFDGRIKDSKDIQFSEYIIHEIGFQTIGWAREEYGDKIADALSLGYNRYEGENPDMSVDDQHSFTLLHVWTRNNEQHNLQLIEMDANGFVLRMSDPSKPYYEHVNNEYPFYIARMIPIVGQFYGYGDGMILKGPQERVNNLADEMELAARFSAQAKVLVDPMAKMGADQLNSNPSEIAICKNPNQTVRVLEGKGLNQVVLQAIQFEIAQAQRSTRFNDTMTGNTAGVSATATQINTQMQQGSVGINDKKSDIARAMEWTDIYCIKLALQYWDDPFWVALGDGEPELVDVMDMRKAPAAIPPTAAFLQKILDGVRKIGRKIPKTDLARDEQGKVIYTNIDVMTKVYIGRGISKDKTTMYNILIGLAGLRGIDENGQPKPIITFKQLVRLLEENLGIMLHTEGEEEPDMTNVQTDLAALTGQNPIGNNQVIQKPQPVAENLMQTVPQMPTGDNRRIMV